MRSFFDNIIAITGTLFLHAALIALLLVGVRWQKPPQQPVATTIKASVVSDEAFRGLDLPEAPPPVDNTAERQREQEADLQRQEAAERQRQEELERQQREAAERQQQEELERQQREVAERQQQEELERQQREAAERQRQEELERQQQEAAERQRQEEAERQRREEAERKKREEAERLRREREAEERRRREREERELQAAREAQLRAEIEAEEQRQGAIRDGLLAQYVEDIRQHVKRSWISPPGVPAGLRCDVVVRQARNGEVLTARVESCDGSDALKRSIEQAVLKASPLPPPPEPSLFEPNLRFPFKTDE